MKSLLPLNIRGLLLLRVQMQVFIHFFDDERKVVTKLRPPHGFNWHDETDCNPNVSCSMPSKLDGGAPGDNPLENKPFRSLPSADRDENDFDKTSSPLHAA